MIRAFVLSPPWRILIVAFALINIQGEQVPKTSENPI